MDELPMDELDKRLSLWREIEELPEREQVGWIRETSIGDFILCLSCYAKFTAMYGPPPDGYYQPLYEDECAAFMTKCGECGKHLINARGPMA